MKYLTQILLSLSIALFSINSVKACVDYHPDSVAINLLVDTLECNLILELSNLNMFGGNPNDFCSCGVYNSIPEDSEILWVAFVDAETNEPLEGFDLWSYADQAGDSWSDADPENINWSGFISGVNTAGITSGQDVNLWIILDIDETNENLAWMCEPGNYDAIEIFSGWAFGTDEWNNDNQDLADSHQSITYFNEQWENMTLDWISNTTYQEYISTLETYYSVQNHTHTSKIIVYPNPSADKFYIKNDGVLIKKIILRDTQGRAVLEDNSSTEEINVNSFTTGIYTLEIFTNLGIETKKIEISN